MRNLAAGIDSSTQSSTVVLRDMGSGAVVAQARAPHPPTTPPVSEQCPEDWWQALLTAFNELREYLPRIACIAVGGQGHGLVMLDETGRPLRKAKLWNDTESASEADYIRTVISDAEFERLTGSLPAPALTISKLLWTEIHHKGLMEKARHIMLPFDYIIYRLCGKAVCERGGTSGTGYFNAYDNRWEYDILEKIVPNLDPSTLPEILPSNAIAGTVQRIKGFEELEGAAVCMGTGDNMAAAIGLNARENDTVISLGTSGTVYTVTSQKIRCSANGLVNYYADATGRYLPMVTTLNATKVTDTFRAILSVHTDEFDRLALSDLTLGGGTVLVPYLDGERTPNLPLAAGRLDVIRTSTTRENIAAAVITGVVCGLLQGREVLKDLGLSMDGRFILTGGGAKSAAYRQILADLSGEDIYTCDFHETAASGAAVLAAASFKGVDVTELSRQWAHNTVKTASPRVMDRKTIINTYKEAAQKVGEIYE